MVTAVVGAGGKTTLIHELAKEYVSAGKRVFVTTSTHMLIESDTLLTDNPEEIKSALIERGYAMAGEKTGEKIKSLSTDTYNEVCKYADEVLVEADGAKHFPLKIPNENEPVIPENTDRIIVVCGMHAIGKRANGTVFRLETSQESAKAGTQKISPDAIITPDIIQQIIYEYYIEKLMKQYPDKEIIIHASGAKTLYERALASLIEAKMDTHLIDEAWFSPKPCLFICGAGHVSKELSDIADKLDMRVTVMDPRTEWANKERFPNAEIINDNFSNIGKYLISDAYYAVITPGHIDDFACVSAIMRTKYKYLGMIGSHKKVEKAIASLEEIGFSKDQISTLHAPIGLSIGAQTPAEIAISILAEIIEIKNKHSVSSVSEELLSTDNNGMLCIIIDKKGSTPRGVGSMMLVSESEIIDTIGGGPIEHAVTKAALSTNTAFICDYSLNNSDAGNLGMACGGQNTVLFLPI